MLLDPTTITIVVGRDRRLPFSAMEHPLKAVYTDLHRSHDPQFFLVRGVVQRTTEQPNAPTGCSRAQGRASRSGRSVVFGQGPRPRVHSPEYLGFLAEARDAWTALGSAGPEMIANMHPVRNAATYPSHIVGRLGWHTIDTAVRSAPAPGRRYALALTSRRRGSTGAGREDRPTRSVALPTITPIPTLPAAFAFSTTARSPRLICV